MCYFPDWREDYDIQKALYSHVVDTITTSFMNTRTYGSSSNNNKTNSNNGSGDDQESLSKKKRGKDKKASKQEQPSQQQQQQQQSQQSQLMQDILQQLFQQFKPLRTKTQDTGKPKLSPATATATTTVAESEVISAVKQLLKSMKMKDLESLMQYVLARIPLPSPPLPLPTTATTTTTMPASTPTTSTNPPKMMSERVRNKIEEGIREIVELGAADEEMQKKWRNFIEKLEQILKTHYPGACIIIDSNSDNDSDSHSDSGIHQ